MSAPLKPWEGAVMNSMGISGDTWDSSGVNNIGRMGPSEPIVAGPSTTSFTNPIPGGPGISGQSVVPGLPPRPMLNQPIYGQTGYSSYGGYGSAYGMGGPYGGYGGIGGLGGGYGGSFGGFGSPYGGGYNRYGNNSYGDVESRFIQMAEENSRPAFQSIESVVSAVGSVAMMLENTFIAMTSSFRAILGVAENFGRLRSLFAQFWSTFAIIRSINWLIRKLLVIMGIRTECEFKAWTEAVRATEAGVATPEQQQRGSSWPILMFLGIIMSAPYLILKLLNGVTSSIQEKLTEPSTWQNPLKAVAQHDFQATTPQELSFKANQILHLAPQAIQGQLWTSGWLMATTDRKNTGLVPVNYIKVIRNNLPQIEEVKEGNEIKAEDRKSVV